MGHDSCDGCRHYLGGGCCRLNEEAECAAGGRELWEALDKCPGKCYDGAMEHSASDARGG